MTLPPPSSATPSRVVASSVTVGSTRLQEMAHSLASNALWTNATSSRSSECWTRDACLDQW